MRLGFLLFVWVVCSVSAYLDAISHIQQEDNGSCYDSSCHDEPINTFTKFKMVLYAFSQTAITMLPFIFMVDW